MSNVLRIKKMRKAPHQKMELALKWADNQVRRIMRLSIKTSIEQAKILDAVKLEEVLDREKIKKLYTAGHVIPDVSQIQYIQVTKVKQ